MPRRPRQSHRASESGVRVDVRFTLRSSLGARALLERCARHAALAEGLTRGSLSIAVVGARRMARLHERYAGVPGATDVLTFDLGTDRRGGWIEGEIVVCADVARAAMPRTALRSATAAALRSELALYVVHGVLHLAGWSDASARDFAHMHARERVLLAQLGLRTRPV
jgi:probable rRNA maturation factor